MSNQGEDGWYPECDKCGCGNLGTAYCDECYDELKKKIIELKKEIRLHHDTIKIQEGEIKRLQNENSGHIFPQKRKIKLSKDFWERLMRY